MKHLSQKEKPTDPGWYLWWDNEKDNRPFHVLAIVSNDEDKNVYVNFSWERGPNHFVPMTEVVDRLWLKVGEGG